MTGAELLRLGRVTRVVVEAECDRRFQQADLAGCYVQCAADMLDRGEYALALRLCRRAAEVCEPFAEVHLQLGAES